MKQNVEQKLVGNAVLEIFEEMIRNMPLSEQIKARYYLNSLIDKEFERRLK